MAWVTTDASTCSPRCRDSVSDPVDGRAAEFNSDQIVGRRAWSASPDTLCVMLFCA